MRILVYKRTHKGDPDRKGCFGIRDCMGRVRGYDYDAVIGIGGMGSQAKAQGIDGKVNWIGIGRRNESLTNGRGPLITFDHFLLFEEDYPDLRSLAPKLARRMYSPNSPRFLFNDVFNDVEQAEVERLLKLAETSPPSAKRQGRTLRARSERHVAVCRPGGSGDASSDVL